MNGLVTQRWRERRDSYRPAGEVIATADYDVQPIPEAAAKAFVLEHHYSASYPVARFRFGLFRGSALVGAAVFSVPSNDRALTNVFVGTRALDSVELGRFVLTDDVPANGETFFLARCFAALRAEGLYGVLSFSDPTPRSRADGSVVFPGHIGTIYQAHNGRYLGRGTARTLRLLPDGRVFSDRAASKIRTGERGWEYAVRQLVAAGAEPPGGADPRAWLAAVLPTITRRMAHPGNHKYAWPLSKSAAKALAPSGPYPKAGGLIAAAT